MIPVSDLNLDAARYSHNTRTVVDVYRNGILTYPAVPVTAIRLSGDRTSKVRLDAQVDLALQPWEATNIDAKVCRFVVRHGLDVAGADQMTALGEFRVETITRSEQGELSMKGSGLEAYVVDARFITPRTPPFGVSTTGQIADLIREALPDARVVTRNTYNKRVQATAPWEKERWDAIDALAQSINAEVFMDYTGQFVIADVPFVTGVPLVIFDEGTAGMLVTRSETEDRAKVYNAVSVSGSSSDPDVPPVWGWAYNNDPTSDTYYYGAFGQVPRFYTSQFFTSDQQCQDYANQLLAQSLAENKTIKFTAFPFPYLEVGDVIGVRNYIGELEVHLVQTTSFNFVSRGDARLSVATLAIKSLLSDGNDL